MFPADTLTDKSERFYAAEVRLAMFWPTKYHGTVPHRTTLHKPQPRPQCTTHYTKSYDTHDGRPDRTTPHHVTPLTQQLRHIKISHQIIREQIFNQYSAEIPYSTEVVVESFRDAGSKLHIEAVILVGRDSQKGIVIGKKGSAIKAVGIASRKELEKFFNKKVYITLRVKVEVDWKTKDSALRSFGYIM